MAKNLISAVVNTSIMEGTEATYTVDVRDYCGSSVDISLVTLEWGVNAPDGALVASGQVLWDSTLDVHQMAFPELSEGIYEYHISIMEDDGSRSVLVQGTLGVFNADSWQEPVLTTNSPNRCLRIWRADGKEQIEASWLATAAAEGFAYKAKEYVEELRDAMPLIEKVKAFIESFEEALREAIKVVDNYLWIGGVNTGHYLKGEDGLTPTYGADGYWYYGDKRVGKARGDDGITPHITADGYWAFGSHKTNVRAAGRDGLDGTAVRRILVDSYEDIPWEGKTCNGGFYYYVYNESTEYATGWLQLVNSPDSDIGLYINGLHIYADANGQNPLQWTELINAADCGVTAVVDSDNALTIKLTAKEAGAAGNSISLELGEAKYGPGAGIVNPNNQKISGATLTGGSDIGWSKYAWLEPDGWVCVGEANDIATSEIYGLVKLGTDVQVENGAPVGRDADGQMAVPVASEALAGTGKLSASGTLSADTDGAIGLNADGAYMAKHATASSFGTVKPSRPDGLARVLGIGIVPDGTLVDNVDRSGQLGCTRAQDDTYGMVKVQYTSTSDKCDDVLWNVPIGIRDDMTETVEGTTDNWYRGANGMLFIPLSEGGAIQWQSTSQTTRHGKTWSTGGSLVFRHTAQFTQGDEGLELNAASESLLAGVYLANGIDDDREAAVFSISDLKNHLELYYYTVDEVYTQEETDTAISNALIPYATISWVRQTYMPRTEVEAKLATKIDCPSKRFEHLEVITASEREAMSSMNSKTLYFVIAG